MNPLERQVMTWQLSQSSCASYRKDLDKVAWHYCSNILCLSKDNIPASIVCYSRDRCTVIGCAPVFSPHGLFLKYNLWEWKKNQSWRVLKGVLQNKHRFTFNSHLSLLRHSKLLKKQVDDIVVYEDLTGEVRFSKHLPNPHNLNKWVLWLHERVDLFRTHKSQDR